MPRQARASNDVQYIKIQTSKGTVAVALADKPVITYANDQLVITTTKEVVEVPVTEITGYNFTEENPSAIRSIEVNRQYKHGLVAFDQLQAGATVALYNAKGEQLLTTTAQADGTAVVDLHEQAKGVYIIRADKLSFKIINK